MWDIMDRESAVDGHYIVLYLYLYSERCPARPKYWSDDKPKIRLNDVYK